MRIYFYVEKVLPVPDHVDYYVNFMDSSTYISKEGKTKTTRRSLPRIDAMLEWGVVKEGDVIVPKGREGEAILLDNGNVLVDQVEKSLQAWLKEIYGWSSVETYAFSVHKESGKSLSEIRRAYMEKEEKDTMEV